MFVMYYGPLEASNDQIVLLSQTAPYVTHQQTGVIYSVDLNRNFSPPNFSHDYFRRYFTVVDGSCNAMDGTSDHVVANQLHNHTAIM